MGWTRGHEDARVASDAAQKFGKNVKRLRKNRRPKLSQAQLATRASVDRTHVSQVEAGKRAVRLETLVKLAGALGVGPEVLLDGLRWIPSTSGKPGRFVIKKD